jgi:glycosyltransferase involved in cell wall biosynthesis
VTSAGSISSDHRGEIAIVTGPLWETWSPDDIERRGLGGTETAAVRVAQALAELGCNVVVYGEVRERTVGGVAYRHHSTFEPTDRRLAVIVSRHLQYFDHPINAQTSMLWMHDPSYQDRLTAHRAAHIDYFLTLNKWHFEQILKSYPFTQGKLRTIRNGIELEYFRHSLQRRKRVVSTSAPTRGIDILLELWPRIRAQVPDAELAYCHTDVYNSLADIRPKLAEHRDLVHELTERTEGARALGALPQQEVAQLLLTSRVWAHPSWVTPLAEPFYETSPIAAMEAQAAGCVVVASKWGGLQDVVKVGRLIDAEPLGERWRNAFVDEIVDGLINPDTQAWAQTRGPEAVAELSWQSVAERLVDLVGGDALRGPAPPRQSSRC